MQRRKIVKMFDVARLMMSMRLIYTGGSTKVFKSVMYEK